MEQEKNKEAFSAALPQKEYVNKPDASISNYYALMIYIILLEETDENHKISAPQIMKKMNEKFGVKKISKNTVHKILKNLSKIRLFGDSILVCPTDPSSRGYYLAKRYFTHDETEHIIIALFSHPYITDEKREIIFDKLRKYSGIDADSINELENYFICNNGASSKKIIVNLAILRKAIKKNVKCACRTRDMIPGDKPIFISPYKISMGRMGSISLLYSQFYAGRLELDVCSIRHFSDVFISEDLATEPIEKAFGYVENATFIDFEHNPMLCSRDRRKSQECFRNRQTSVLYLFLKADIEAAKEYIRSEDDKVEEKNGKVYLILHQLKEHILSYAMENPELKLVGPSDLVTKVTEQVKSLSDIYVTKER